VKHTTDKEAMETSATFSTDTVGLAETTSPAVAELKPDDRFSLRIAPVAKTLGGDRVRMLS